ncbi:MAG TPA: DNA polymerase IV [Candidatus Copromonas faecavium]|uniref:DNA polymerase IV n=1 Tax=Candidatus Copromonas faecavium (nom. illeg.) TaxID=2840740 RepID=A0A9D1A2Q1_9FIRM|nr:DNA polymerase IV [Candidatus Copromonas faecavium]
MGRVIFHVDVNSAFLSWEAVYRLHHLGGTLDLRTIPSAVGGDQEKRHGIILAKSIPAKKYKIQTGEPVANAKEKCPELVLVPPNYELYQRSSRALLRILADYTDKIEQYSIDEAFMDMTGCSEQPEQTAGELKERVYRELGFTVNVGVSSNKLLAKMASDFQKPNLVHTLWPGEIQMKMWGLPVRELFSVGHASEKKLAALGVHTIGQLAETPDSVLYGCLKSHGLQIKRFANGLDDSPVAPAPPPNKGYGNSLTTPRDVTDRETARLFLLSLAETLSARLRADGAMIRTVEISLRDCHLKFSHRQRALETPTDLTVEIHEAACRCFEELWDGTPLRHLGIHTSGVTRTMERQLGLFDRLDYEKYRCAEAAVDRLRKRYGQDIIKRAVFVEAPGEKRVLADHMGGGISREKRRVDYTKEIIL